MTSSRNTKRTWYVGIAAGAVLAMGVSGCNASNQPSARPGAANAASTSPSVAPSSGKTGKPGKSHSSSAPSASTSPTALPTKAPIQKGLTKQYPKADVPLVAGKVLKSTDYTTDDNGQNVAGWSVEIRTHDGSVGNALSRVSSALGSGFHQSTRKKLGGKAVQVTFKGSTYDNRVIVSPQKGSAVFVIYNVTKH